ncbi:MAG: hypothetical protein KJ576_20880 [Proteobacteria bacterium]|nr:hypothetical protein [Pseudomonadota bacterium]
MATPKGFREKLKAFAELKHGEVKSMFIDEVGETVFWRPMTLKQRGIIRKQAMVDVEVPDDKGKMVTRKELDAEKFDLFTVVAMAEDADGNQLFSRLDVHWLQNVLPSETLAKIAGAINGLVVSPEAMEDAEKNSPTQ